MIKSLSPKFGMKVHERDNHGYTLLHCAAQGGHSEVARYLIEEVKMDPQDRDMVCGGHGKGRCVPNAKSAVSSGTLHIIIGETVD